MAVAGNTPTASFLTNIGKMQSAGCRLCRIAREASQHSVWRHLYASMHAARKPKSKLKFVTLDKESNISTLWRRKEFLRIYCKEDLTEKAQDIEMTISVKKSQKARYNLDPESFFVNRFWGRRPDGFAINVTLQIEYILKSKRSTDRDEEFLEVKEAEANERTKASLVRSKLLLRSGNLSRLTCGG